MRDNCGDMRQMGDRGIKERKAQKRRIVEKDTVGRRSVEGKHLGYEGRQKQQNR